jgi:HAD superfamily hydrolase (TIGR01450 family)
MSTGGRVEVLPSRLRRIRHVALDLDGTIYRGDTLFPSTLPFLKLLSELGVGYTFLTNNSSKSTRDYLTHLQRLGIGATPGQLYTSTQATISYLRQSRPEAKRLFILGTESMIDEMRHEGFVPTFDNPSDEPEAVIVGFDTGLVFARLCRAAYWIHKGKPFIATHPDRVCPTDQPTMLVDCGSICAALERATGRPPDAVLGKPDPCMLRGILDRHALSEQELAMVGDRLYTDMVMARTVGALAVLVLTGETTMNDLKSVKVLPDLIVSGLEEFSQKLRQARLNSSRPTAN